MLRAKLLFAFLGTLCLFFPMVRAGAFPFQFNESISLFEELTTSFLTSSEVTAENGHEEGHSSLHLASWNYDYVAVPLHIALFILLTGLVKIVFHHVPHLASYIPESCILIIIGTIMGAILYFAAGVPHSFKLESSTFMLFLLPPIVLEAAYSLNDRTFSDHIGTVLLYAVVGTVINFLIIGFSLYGLDLAGAMGLPEGLHVSMMEYLLFASLIVAVDPVAVLVIFQDVGVHKTLYFLVFGESLLNDAVTIVLNNMMMAFDSTPHIDAEAILTGIGSFFTISLGALAVGVVVGIISTFLTRITGHVRVIEPLLIFVMAYLAYLCAELFHWSGIISMVGCGLVQAQYALHNISRNSQITVHYFIKVLSSTCESVVFLFLGLELVRTEHVWSTGFVLWTLFLCLVARVVSVFGLTFLVNLKMHHKIKLEEQFVMWYGGLRGAIAFVLCSTVIVEEREKNMFLTTTFFIILFTVFVQGITVKPLVKYYKIMMQGDDSKDLMVELQNLVDGNLTSGLVVGVLGQHGETNFHTWIYKMNDKYLKRWFQKHPLTDKEQFLDLYKQVSIQRYESMVNSGNYPVVSFQIGERTSVDLSNDTREDSASSIRNYSQDEKLESSKAYLSKDDMHHIFAKAKLARNFFPDRYLVHHDFAEIPYVSLITPTNEELARSLEDVNQVLTGSTRQLNFDDQIPFRPVMTLHQSHGFLTPTNSMRRKIISRNHDGFQLKKATSVFSVNDIQRQTIAPNLIMNNSLVKQKTVKQGAVHQSNSLTDPPSILFKPSRSRKTSGTYDSSQKLTALGEELTKDAKIRAKEQFYADQEKANENGAYINEVIYNGDTEPKDSDAEIASGLNHGVKYTVDEDHRLNESALNESAHL